MNSFTLTALPTGTTKVTSWRPRKDHRGWDTIGVSLAGRMSVDAMRDKFSEGKNYSAGLGFACMEVDVEAMPGGWSRASLELRGLFKAKKWGYATSQSLRRETQDTKLTIGSTDYTIAKLASIEAQPGFVARVFDQFAPDYTKVGKKHTTPYAGLVFPFSTRTNPWTFWGSYTPTVNYPSGWVLMDLQCDQIGDTKKLYDKTYTFLWVDAETP